MKDPFNGNNDCVFCENEQNDATCSYYGEKITHPQNNPSRSKALRHQTSCPGFILLERMREQWEERQRRNQ